MKATTIMKRINTQRKEIIRYEKEIARYKKTYLADDCPEHMKEEGRRWIEYYRKHIKKVEDKIAEMSKQAAEIADEEERREMIRAMADDMEKNGLKLNGYTTKGLRYGIDRNKYGFTDRTTHCWSMWIEGMGTVFTSGTLDTVAKYILFN